MCACVRLAVSVRGEVSAGGPVLSSLSDSSLPSALAAPASLRPHRPRPLDPGDLLSWWGGSGAGHCRGLPLVAGAGGGARWLGWVGHGLGMARVGEACLGEGQGGPARLELGRSSRAPTLSHCSRPCPTPPFGGQDAAGTLPFQAGIEAQG